MNQQAYNLLFSLFFWVVFRTDVSAVEGPLTGQFKYDMGWQKRGSGRSYDSSSGVGTLMGNLTGKIVGCDIRSKVCRVSDNHEGSHVPEHDCRRNWAGSSKAMEPDVAVSLVKQIQDKGVNVGTIIMDDDSTTLSRITSALGKDVVKWSDLNHTKNILGIACMLWLRSTKS